MWPRPPALGKFAEEDIYAINRKLSNKPVRVKGGMSLRNGMWHGLRNDIIMRNVIYAE